MRMQVWSSQLWSVRYTLLTAFITVLAFTLPFSDISKGEANRWYDANYPVVRMSGKLVKISTNEIVIHVAGEKLRACRFLSLSAYKRVDGQLKDAFLDRVEGSVDGSTKPVGTYDLGLWRIHPADANEVQAVLMHVTHECEGRVVVTKIAEVRPVFETHPHGAQQ